MKNIYTQRCLLRKWNENDLQDLKEIFYSSEVAQLAGFTVKTTEEDVKEVLHMFIHDSEKGLWAVEYMENSKAIGWIEIHPFAEEDKYTFEIGYTLNKSYWGKGIMPEVVQAIIVENKQIGQIKRLICSHVLQNTQSKRVIEKCGFRYWKQSELKQYYDIVLY